MTDIDDLTREQTVGYEQYLRNQDRIDAEFAGSWIVINREQEYRMETKLEMQRFIYLHGFVTTAFVKKIEQIPGKLIHSWNQCNYFHMDDSHRLEQPTTETQAEENLISAEI